MSIKKTVHVFGYNGDIDTGTEDVWSAGGAYTFRATPTIPTIVSGSSDDDATDTWARTVRIMGLDSDYMEFTEDVALDGATPVTLANSYLRINQMIVLTAGTGAINAGALTVADTDAATIGYMGASEGASDAAIYTIPADYERGELTLWWISKVLSSGNVTARLQYRPQGGAWITIDKLVVSDAGAATAAGDFIRQPIRIPPRADVRIRATSTADNAIVWGSFDIDLYEKAG